MLPARDCSAQVGLLNRVLRHCPSGNANTTIECEDADDTLVVRNGTAAITRAELLAILYISGLFLFRVLALLLSFLAFFFSFLANLTLAQSAQRSEQQRLAWGPWHATRWSKATIAFVAVHCSYSGPNGMCLSRIPALQATAPPQWVF